MSDIVTPTITNDVIVLAVRTWGDMTLEQRLALSERAYESQPHLFGSFLVLNRVGVSLDKMNFALEVCFVALLAMERTGLDWPCITEAVQDRAMARIHGMAALSEGLAAHLQHDGAAQAIADLREKHLAAYVVGRLNEWCQEVQAEDSDKYVMLATYSLLICLSLVTPRRRRKFERANLPTRRGNE